MLYNITNREGSRTISVFLDNGESRVVPSTSASFLPLLTYLTSNDEHDEAEVKRLVDPAVFIGSEMAAIAGERITYDLSNLYFDGKPMHTVIAKHIKEKIQAQDSDWKRLVRFMLNVDENPSYRCQKEVYNWVERTGLTLTEDGCFLGYKAVESGSLLSSSSGPDNYIDGVLYKNGESTQVPHAIGSVVSKKRADVDDAPGGGCSVGLHVGTYDYATRFIPGGTLVTVKVNPRDVVSVPSHNSEWKIRVCKYEVVALNEKKEDFIGKTPSLDFPKDEPLDSDDTPLSDVEEEILNGDLSPQESAELEEAVQTLSSEPEDDIDPMSKIGGVSLEGAQPTPEGHILTQPYTFKNLAEAAQAISALRVDLHNDGLGHKEVARKWSEITTESSVRRYRKAKGIVTLTSASKRR